MALLELKTEGNQDAVTIDGQDYNLAAYDGFSITESHQLQKDGIRLQEIGKQSK